MKFYGNANLQQNELQNAVLPLTTSWPLTPKVGELVFKDKILYICVTAGELPVWVPLTSEISMYVHAQDSGSDSWTVTHNLNTGTPSVQVWASDNTMIIPDVVTVNSNNQVTIDFSVAQVGRAVVLVGPQEGSTKPVYAYTHLQSSPSSTWTVNHALGYQPIVRVFIGQSEVQPASISHTDNFNTVITFSSPQVGYAKFI